MIARDAYAPDMLTSMMTAGDALLNGVAGRATFYTPEDVRQGAAPADGDSAFTLAMQNVAATPNTQAASGVMLPQLTGLVPDILSSPVATLSGYFERGAFVLVALVVIAGGFYLFAKD